MLQCLSGVFEGLNLAELKKRKRRNPDGEGIIPLNCQLGPDLFSGFQQRVTQIAQGKAQKKIEAEERPILGPVAPTLPSGDALQLKK